MYKLQLSYVYICSFMTRFEYVIILHHVQKKRFGHIFTACTETATCELPFKLVTPSLNLATNIS